MGAIGFQKKVGAIGFQKKVGAIGLQKKGARVSPYTTRPLGVANLDPRGVVVRIYKGDY